MSIVKVIEVIGEGATFDAALKSILEEASKTVQEINQIDVKHVSAIVEKNKIAKVRVNAHLSFLVKH